MLRGLARLRPTEEVTGNVSLDIETNLASYLADFVEGS
jgi:hypothetical protein